ncbi:MAG: hypothetical protein ACFNVO_07820, partial [Prevotella sp.]
MGKKHHRICCIKIGLRGARMRKTSMLAVVKEGEGRLQEPSALIAVYPHHALFAAIAIGNQRARMGKMAWGIRQNGVAD